MLLSDLPLVNIKLQDGTMVTVPDSLHLMTPYILIEQGDWFEQEINFVREYMQPGMRVIDIGANYGLYALSLAKKVGNTGRIWAFEPTPSVAQCLATSIKNNALTNITLIDKALSDHCGQAELLLNPNSENNCLSPHFESHEQATYQPIELVTLDSCWIQGQWGKIDFIKLDAEGEEEKIIRSSSQILNTNSPLIMYELKHNNSLNLSLINTFEEYGYHSYYLIPGLNILAPFVIDEFNNGFLINLFCCKEDKARELEGEDKLLYATSKKFPSAEDDSIADDLWLSYFMNYPFCQSLLAQWKNYTQKNSNESWILYKQVLNNYILSLSPDLAKLKRFYYLQTAFNSLKKLIINAKTLPRLMTLARIALDIGQRQQAVEITQMLINEFPQDSFSLFAEPFFPVLPRFDHIDPGIHVKTWLVASLYEQFEKYHTHSSYFNGKKSLPRLDKMKTLGFFSEEMNKRLVLIKTRFALEA